MEAVDPRRLQVYDFIADEEGRELYEVKEIKRVGKFPNQQTVARVENCRTLEMERLTTTNLKKLKCVPHTTALPDESLATA